MIQISEILELSLFKDFKIICGEKYLNNLVNATVILEYESSRIDYEGYSYGYFVLLSYFFADSDPELVNGTLRTLIQKQVSGIAIKIPPDRELPEDIIKLAKLYHVPLFSFYEQFMEDSDSLKEKIEKVAKEIYGADDVTFSKKVLNKMKKYESQGLGNLPICVAKTQYSLSDDPTLLGKPSGFKVTISDLIPNTGAGFLVAISGDIMRMPGLPKVPAAVNMDIDEEGKIVGLF